MDSVGVTRAAGWIAMGANTPAHVGKLLDVRAIAPALVEPLLEKSEAGLASFARTPDPRALRVSAGTGPRRR